MGVIEKRRSYGREIKWLIIAWSLVPFGDDIRIQPGPPSLQVLMGDIKEMRIDDSQ
jgi:hypothetical protein